MEILIREAEQIDLQAILNLYAQPDMDDGEIISIERAKEIFDNLKRYPYYKVFVAVTEKKIVGTFELLVMDNLAHQGSPSAIIEDMVVSAEYRRRGIGSKMIEFAVERCREIGCYKVALSSNLKRENAHKFYESLGFMKHGYSFLLEI